MTGTSAGWAALSDVLKGMAGPEATPRADQVLAVDALVSQRRRVLLVQPTGWGKSAVYWAAAKSLRAAGGGPTVVISPLLALMRDQIDAATRAGLRAATVNSANVDDWQGVFGDLRADRIDVLLVSPERLANPRFAEVALPLLATAGLLVIDEAHCISDWGFDFRPDYQRITRLLADMTAGTPVLATTATANARVTDDVAAQLGSDTLVLRGQLARASLTLAVVPGLDGLQRMAWVSDALDALPGSGIVYGLTVANVHALADFLLSQGHAVAAYSGQTPTDERAGIEDALRANTLKAVVATSALGMGYDKPDLAFCIHVGSPDSPVAYYQQVGRAGRAIDEAVGVLLPAAESDERIWEYFATATVPDPEVADRVLATLADATGPMTVPALESETGARRGRLESLLKVLQVDGAVTRVGSGWEATRTGWQFDAGKYARLVSARRDEAALMRAYADGQQCLMQVLTRALDDPGGGPCGRCSVCTGELPPPGRQASPDRVSAATSFARRRTHIVEPRSLWPRGSGHSGRIRGLAPGRAVAFADDAAWSSVISELSGQDAPPSQALNDALVDVLRRWSSVWDARPVAVVPVPSRRNPRRVAGMAQHVATVGRLPLADPLRAVGRAPSPGASSGRRVADLHAGFEVVLDDALPHGPVLLVDDVARTRWTVTVAAARLHEVGVTVCLPLVGHLLP